MKAIIFDFDGVIHDTFEFHRKKIKEFTGIELSRNDLKNVHKKNFYFNIPSEFKNINWESYRDYVYEDQSNLEMTQVIRDRIIELSKKYDLYIVTSGGTKNVSDYLGNNGILKIFKEVLGLEISKSKVEKFKLIFKKYKLEKEDCLFVTDTLGDILEANKVGLKTIAVDFGFHCRKTLEKGNPYKIISSFNELLEIVE